MFQVFNGIGSARHNIEIIVSWIDSDFQMYRMELDRTERFIFFFLHVFFFFFFVHFVGGGGGYEVGGGAEAE